MAIVSFFFIFIRDRKLYAEIAQYFFSDREYDVRLIFKAMYKTLTTSIY